MKIYFLVVNEFHLKMNYSEDLKIDLWINTRKYTYGVREE